MSKSIIQSIWFWSCCAMPLNCSSQQKRLFTIPAPHLLSTHVCWLHPHQLLWIWTRDSLAIRILQVSRPDIAELTFHSMQMLVWFKQQILIRISQLPGRVVGNPETNDNLFLKVPVKISRTCWIYLPKLYVECYVQVWMCIKQPFLWTCHLDDTVAVNSTAFWLIWTLKDVWNLSAYMQIYGRRTHARKIFRKCGKKNCTCTQGFDWQFWHFHLDFSSFRVDMKSTARFDTPEHQVVWVVPAGRVPNSLANWNTTH